MSTSITPRAVTLRASVAALLVTLAVPTLTQATDADANGSWTGRISGSISGCLDSADDGPDAVTVTLVLTQSGGTVSGSGSFDGGGSISGLSGSFSSGELGGSFNYTDSDGTAGEGFFLASISGDTLVFDDLQTYDQTGDTCMGTYSGTLTRQGASRGEGALEEQPGEIATNDRQLRTQVTTFTNAIGSHLRNLSHNVRGLTGLTGTGGRYETGLAAGDGTLPGLGGWLSYNYTDLSNDFSGAAYDGDAHNVVGGFDIRPLDRTVLGIAVGWEWTDLDTPYNGGEVAKDGVTIAPYVAVLVTDQLSLDASFGYSSLETEQFRLAGTSKVSASNGSDRWFGSANLSGFWQHGNWSLSPRTGFVYATEDVDGFTESNGNIVASREVTFGQYHVGGEIAYLWGNWEPMVGAVYELDFSKDEYSALDANGNLVVVNRDDDNVLFNAGVRYRHPGGFTGSLEYRGRFGRQYVDEDNITATLRIDF